VAISVGSVEVDVIPSTQGIYQRLRDGLVPAATKAGEDAGSAAGRAFGPAMQTQIADVGLRIGQQIGDQIAARITAALRTAIRDGITQGGRTALPAATRQGDDTGGAFARAMKARLEAAFRTLPKVNIDADTSEADADLQALRARMETLASKRIGIDIDAQVARTEIEDIERELTRLGAAHPNVTVRADTAKARADLLAVREEIDRISARPAHVRLDTDGAFGQKLRAAVAAAQAALPDITIGADTGEAQAEIAALRVRLGTLSEQRIGIDIDAATARQQLTDIQQRLFRLSGQRVQVDVDAGVTRADAVLANFRVRLDELRGRTATVDVRVDAATAEAHLAAVGAMIAALNDEPVRIIPEVSNAAALSALFQLGIALGAVAAIPAFPILAAGAGLFTSAVVAAGVGVGALAAVALPAVAGITGALQAQKAAQDAATNSALKGGQAASQGASQALQAAGAQQALASAERNGALQIAQAGEQVTQAKRAVGDAIQQAALKTQQAERAVQDAERALAQAQKDATKAQLDLTAARKQAALDLEDLNNQLVDSQLSQRDAVIQVQQATTALHATQNNPSATALQREQAQLTYDQAVQHLKEQGIQVQRLKDQTTAANKAGVEGSTTVKSAQDQLAQSQQQVVDRTRALKDAQAEQARTAVANARSIADAQQKVADSERAAAQAQAQAADSIASAQRQIASSALSAGGVDQAAVAQAKYQQALDKLTPAARGTFNAFVSLKDAFKAWSTALQPQVMPLFTRAILGLKAALPSLTPFVLAAASAIKTLQDRASAGFKSPWWQTFKQDLATSAGPALVGLGIGFGRAFKGMVGVIDAFLPHLTQFGARFETLTAHFANWGAGLKGSPAFEQFLAYSSRTAPVLAGSLRDILSAFLKISEALSPLSGPILQILGALARGLASIAQTLPWLIQGLYLVYVATRLWTIAMWLLNAALDADPLVLIILAILALVAAVIYAYNHWTGFRQVIQAAWKGIQKAASQAAAVLHPIFSGIATAAKKVGDGAVYLWQVAIGPTFRAIAKAATSLWQTAIGPAVNGIAEGVRKVGAVAVWLWQTALGPAFRAIAVVATALWQNALQPVVNAISTGFQKVAAGAAWLWNSILSPIFNAISLGARILIAIVLTVLIAPLVIAFHVVGALAGWLWDVAIGPAFRGIAALATWLWQNAIQPAFNGIAIVATWLYQNIIKLYFDLMVAEFRFVADIGMWLWNNALAPAFRGIAAVATWLWQNAIQPAFNGISEVATWLYDHALKPVFDNIKTAVGLVGDAFGLAKDAIKLAWDKLIDITKAPINFVIKWVYTNGIKAVWDKIAGFVGLDKLPDAPQLLASGGTLGNGWGPARPMVTNRPTAIVGEGNPNYPEYVIPTDPRYRDRALALHAAAGTQLMDGGGILGGLKSAWNWTKDTVGDIVGTGIDWAKKGADLIANPSKIWDDLVKPILAKVSDGVGSFPMGKMLAQFPIKIVGSLKDKIVHAVSSIGSFFGGGSGGGGVGAPSGSGVTRWTPQVIQALAANGLSTSPDMVARILRQIETESGGNERAVQGDIGDINNLTGDLAKGLMQTISATFNAYKFPGHGDIFNGYDNLLAALNYAKHRYGPGLSFLGQGHGYDTGGYLQPGMNLAYNGTGRPEPVFTTQQANLLTRLALAPAAGGIQPGDTLTLVVDGQEFHGYVDSRADGRVHSTLGLGAQMARAGRG
jgi:hypothetical protein